MKKKLITSIGVIVAIACVAVVILWRENLKFKDVFIAYQSKQYVPFQNDKVEFEVKIIDGRHQIKESEDDKKIMFSDQKGNEYSANIVEKNIIDDAYAYEMYSYRVEIKDLPIGKTIMKKMYVGGEWIEIGKIILDSTDVKFLNDVDGLNSLGIGMTIVNDCIEITVESKVENCIVKKIKYDLGEGEDYITVGLNKKIEKNKDTDIDIKIDKIENIGYVTMNPIIEMEIDGKNYKVISSMFTTTYNGLSKQDILDYITLL